MKTPHFFATSHFKKPKAIAKVLSVLALLALPQMDAATLYWDGNSTTAGAGTTPTGTWGTSTFWSSNSAGTSSTSNTTTTLKDDLYFSAGTDATGSYTVTLNGIRSGRILIIDEGSPTFTGGTLYLSSSNGGITVNTTTGTTTVSSDLTIAGAQILNVATGGTLDLNTGTFIREAGATLNVLGAGTVNSTKTNLSTNQASGIIGTWASIGTGASTKYATFSGSTITSYTGTAAATAAALTDTTGLINYDLAAASGTVPGTVSANTIRYTGSSGTTALGSTAFSVNGLLNAGTGTWTISTNTLTIGADQELVVNAANNAITISSVIQDNGNGASGITKTGNKTLNLSGTNTYTGVTYISQGTVAISNNSALGSTTGNTVINVNGSTSTGGALSLSGNITTAENIVLVGPGDGISASYSPSITSSSGNNTITGTITLSGSTSYRLGASSGAVLNVGLIQRTGSDSSSLIISASGTGIVNITEAIKNNNGGLTVHGGGVGILSASNNEIGNVVVQNNSTLKLAADNALSITRDLQVGNYSTNTATSVGNDVGTLYLEGVSQTVNALNGYVNLGTSPNNATTSDKRKITSSSANNSSLTVGYNNGTGTFDGVIEDGSGGGHTSFTKAGTGSQTLTGTVANTYTGDTTVTGGTLILAKTAGINAVSGNLNIGDGSGTDVVRLTNSDQIADTSLVTFNSSTGILRLNNQSETVGGLSSTGGAGIVENESGSAATSTLGVNVATGTTQSYSGTLRDGDGSGTDGTLAVVKSGDGTQVFSGASTYTGGTTVDAGILLANNSSGSATGSGPILISTAATFGGIGRVELGASSRATIMGTLSPGDASSPVETLEFSIASATGANSSGLTFDSSTLAFDLAAAGSSVASFGSSDMLLVTGTLNESSDIAFTGSNVFDFGGTGEYGWYKLLDSSATSAFEWDGLTVDSNGLITAGLSYTNLASGLTGSFYLGNGSTSGDFGDLYFQAVPEPSRALLLFGGLLAVVYRRRRIDGKKC